MKLFNKPKIIMNILSSVGIDGGVPNKVMDVYRRIDRNKYQFHFFLYTHDNSTNTFEQEIKSLGGKVFYFGKIREIGFFRFYFNFYRVLKAYDYDAIHSYNGINDGILILIARIAKIRKRISHSRGAQVNSKTKKIFSPILRKIITSNSNILLSCSEKAGEFLFGGKDFTIVPNPIETNRFLSVSHIKVQQLKNDLGVSKENFVIGHVGRFSAEKNHAFILKIAKELTNQQVNFKVIFVGDGELKSSVKDEAINLGIQDKIIFAGNRTNVEEFYDLFDVLLFPSLHEGFGNVAVEGQVSRVKVIASTGVSEEVDLGLGLIKFIDIGEFDEWVQEILITRYSKITVSEIEIKDALNNRGFGIDGIIKKYSDIYSG